MYRKLVHYWVCSACLFASAFMCSTAGAAETCDRACLTGFIDRYLEALVAHDPSRLPIAPQVKFTENGQPLEVGDALWATASGNASFRIDAVDPETGQAAFTGVIEENGSPALMSLRLKIDAGLITEIESVVARNDSQFFGVKFLTQPEPIYAEILAPAERVPRERMIAIADSYFAALERMDGKRFVPFATTCNRIENGFQTTNNPAMDTNPDDDFSISSMSCIEQFKTGYLKFVTGIRRRMLVVDEERGIVFNFALLDHAGNIHEVTMTDGRTLPVNVKTPFTWLGGGLFKIKNGEIHRIYTVLIRAPYKMSPGWE